MTRKAFIKEIARVDIRSESLKSYEKKMTSSFPLMKLYDFFP